MLDNRYYVRYNNSMALTYGLEKRTKSQLAAAWNLANPDKVKTTRKAYYERHKTELQARSREAYQANPAAGKERQKNFRLSHPWYDSYLSARQRCNNPKHPSYPRYGAKGIKFLLSKEDMRRLWTRSKASQLISPSLHRINSSGDYVLSNCRFIELAEHSRKSAMERWARIKKATKTKTWKTTAKEIQASRQSGNYIPHGLIGGSQYQ